ncbi:uncharacterized protein JCM10292_000390 [Rhodotorula paludigena]|uniref:uncharacterized protein n=1 Tax=Rhodotorula paludigena TaxID=86838 RepID=UPI00318159CF
MPPFSLSSRRLRRQPTPSSHSPPQPSPLSLFGAESHSSLASSSSVGPSTPSASSSKDVARLSAAWSVVSTSGPAEVYAVESGRKGEQGQGGSGGRIGRIFRRIRSRKSLRGLAQARAAGEGTETSRPGREHEIPPVPSLPPQLELLPMPNAGPELLLEASELATGGFAAQIAEVQDSSHDFAAVLPFVHAGDQELEIEAAETVALPLQPSHAPLRGRQPPLPLPKPTQQHLFSLSTSHSAVLPDEDASDAYGDASSDDERVGRAARHGAPSVSSSRSTSYSSPRTPHPPPSPVKGAAVAARLLSHAADSLSPSSATIGPVTYSAFGAPVGAPSSTLTAFEPRRLSFELRKGLGHASLLHKLRRGPTLLETLELAQSSSSSAPPSARYSPLPSPSALHPVPHLSPSTRPDTPSPFATPVPFAPLFSTCAGLACLFPRLARWASRPSFAERMLVTTSPVDGGPTREDAVRSARRATLRPSPRVQAMLASLQEREVLDAQMDGRGDDVERPEREARPRPVGTAYPPSPCWPAAPGAARTTSSSHGPQPPISLAPKPQLQLPLKRPVLPGPLLLHSLVKQQVGRDDLNFAAAASEDDDDQPLALLSRGRPLSTGPLSSSPSSSGPAALNKVDHRVDGQTNGEKRLAALEAGVKRLQARERDEQRRRAMNRLERRGSPSGRPEEDERARRTLMEQKRRSRAMHVAGRASPDRRISQQTPQQRHSILAPSPAQPHLPRSASQPFLAVPAWSSVPTFAFPIPVPVAVPCYQLPPQAYASARNLPTSLHKPSTPPHPPAHLQLPNHDTTGRLAPAAANQPSGIGGAARSHSRDSLAPPPFSLHRPLSLTHARSSPSLRPHTRASDPPQPKTGAQAPVASKALVPRFVFAEAGEPSPADHRRGGQKQERPSVKRSSSALPLGAGRHL